MKVIKILVIIIAVVIIAMLIFLPSTFDVKRTIVIKAPVEIVFNQINDLKKWTAWSPWEKMDSNMIKTYSDKTVGLNAQFSWVSENPKVGIGSMEITEVIEKEKISTSITNEAGDVVSGGFTFETNGDETKVDWGMYSEYSTFQLQSRFFALIFKSILEETFDQGLSSLKDVAESIEVIPYSLTISEMNLEDKFIIAIKDSSSTDHEEISGVFAKSYGEIWALLAENKIKPTGSAISVAHNWSPEENKYVFEAAFPIGTNKIKTKNNIYVRQLNGGKHVVGEQLGPYSELEKSYESIMKYIEENSLEIAGYPYEEYINTPNDTKPADLKTLIYFPVK